MKNFSNQIHSVHIKKRLTLVHAYLTYITPIVGTNINGSGSLIRDGAFLSSVSKMSPTFEDSHIKRQSQFISLEAALVALSPANLSKLH